MSDVVYVVDKRYFNLFKTSCYSLIKNSTVDINIHILTKDNEFDDDQKNKIIDILFFNQTNPLDYQNCY